MSDESVTTDAGRVVPGERIGGLEAKEEDEIARKLRRFFDAAFLSPASADAPSFFSWSFGWFDRAVTGDGEAALSVISALFAAEGCPSGGGTGLLLYRDVLGKPCVAWEGAFARWAEGQRLEARCCHVSNTHDGGRHLVLAAYSERLAGLGIDLVYLPRLRAPGKNAAYLSRFAAGFMSSREREAFEMAGREDDEETLRRRIAAHFSLMEAASKALGTGLRIGVGMGLPESLPKRALGALRLTPVVELLIEEPAQRRMALLGACAASAHWTVLDDFLISVVLLWKGAEG